MAQCSSGGLNCYDTSRRTRPAAEVLRGAGDIEEFTIQLGDDAIDVYAGYRNLVVERVEGCLGDGGDPETRTVDRLDRIVSDEG